MTVTLKLLPPVEGLFSFTQMPKPLDITGRRYTRLTAICRVENNRHGKAQWRCQCDCGNTVVTHLNELQKGNVKSCGCLPRGRRKLEPLAARFWDHVRIGGATDCWPWQRFRNENGYGVAWTGERLVLAHRVAWSLHNSEEPSDYVLHHCDEPSCCNPAHLYEGSQADNTRDKLSAGRCRNGATGPMTAAEREATKGVRRW